MPELGTCATTNVLEDVPTLKESTMLSCIKQKVSIQNICGGLKKTLEKCEKKRKKKQTESCGGSF